MAQLKTILAYGDSLTFGADPEHDSRHAFEDRWPSVLEQGLAGRVRVIAEGLGGRTTAFDDFAAADRNGARVLPVMLASHSPIDLAIIMLGTNDLKPYLNGTALGAALGMKRLVEIIRTYPYNRGAKAPKVILVSPPLAAETQHAEMRPLFPDGIAESKRFAGYYSAAARDLGCGFFDAATVAVASPSDGIHLDAENTRAIGRGLVPLVREILAL